MVDHSGADISTAEEPAQSSQRKRSGVRELAFTQGGCWKVMDSGRKIQLNETEWRGELARHFGKPESAVTPAD